MITFAFGSPQGHRHRAFGRLPSHRVSATFEDHDRARGSLQGRFWVPSLNLVDIGVY